MITIHEHNQALEQRFMRLVHIAERFREPIICVNPDYSAYCLSVHVHGDDVIQKWRTASGIVVDHIQYFDAYNSGMTPVDNRSK